MSLHRSEPSLRSLSLVVAIGSVMTVLDTTIVNVAIHVLGRDLDAPLSTTQWVVSGYTLALSMTIPLTGWAVDRFGTRRLWITSLALFTAGSALCAAAWSPASLILFRVLQGVGGGLLMPVGQTMLARAAGPGRMGRAMAVVSVPAMLAPVLGPVLGGVLLDQLSWRWMFLINLPICAAALLLALRLLPAGSDATRVADRPLDRLGLILLSPGLAAFVYGLSEAGNGKGATSAGVLLGVGGGAVLLTAFVLHARRRGDRALLDLRLFADRTYATAGAALLCYSLAMFGVLILIPLFAQTVRGGDALAAGLLVAPLGVGALVTMPLTGRFVDRRGARPAVITGVALTLLGTAVFAFAPPVSVAVPVLVAAVFVAGLGHGMVVPSVMATAFQRLSTADIPAASTVVTIVARVGSAVGAALLVIVLQVQLRSHAVPGPAFTAAFRVALVLSALALVAAILLPRTSRLPAGAPAPRDPAQRTPDRVSPAE